MVLNVIIVSHGSYAQALLESSEMILGKQAAVTAMGLFPGDSVDAFREQLNRMIADISQKDEVLVLSDMQSGSPFNSAVAVMMLSQFRHITGINLPVLLEILGSRAFMDVNQLCQEVMSTGPKTLVDVNKYLKEL